MPGFFTHYLSGCKFIESMDNQELLNIILNNREIFDIGTQGPDVLFYYPIRHWKSYKHAGNIGRKLHNQNIGDFFSSAIEYTKTHTEKETLTAYLCGYLCHYMLDSLAHPYVFYKTGFIRQGEHHTYKYSCYHHMFEYAIDFLLLELISCEKPCDKNKCMLMKADKKELQTVSSMYEYALYNAYNVKVRANDIVRSIKDMSAIHRILRDKTGIKKKIFRGLEGNLGCAPLISSMIYPLNITDGFDYLNSKHEPWVYPHDDIVKVKQSFLEMFDQSVLKTRDICKSLLFYLSDLTDKQTLLNEIGNCSLISGMDCSKPVEFKYFDCIYEQPVL